MHQQKACVALLLFVLVLCSSVSSQKITLGKTVTKAGPGSRNTQDAVRGYQAFAAALGPTLTVGGVNYSINHVEYNDAGDAELILILYERLLTVDKADFIWTPFLVSIDISYEDTAKILALADNYSVPTMNTGIFDVFIQPQKPNPWMNTYLTPLSQFFPACADPLQQRGAKTAIVAIEKSFAIVQGLYKGSYELIIQPTLIDPEDFTSTETLDKYVKEWKKLDPDVLITSGDTDQMIALLDRIRKNRFEPRALHIVTGGGSEDFARKAGWKAGNVIITSDFEPRLNYSDPLFGSAMQYQDLLVQLFNSTSAISDSYYAQAGTVLVESLKAAGTIDRAAVMQKLRSFNGTTIAGPTSFELESGYLQRPYYCLQFSADGSSKRPVNPNSLPSYTPIVYPATVVYYPPGYFPKKKDLVKIVAPAVICSVALILIVAAVIYLIVRSKYHLVMVPKAAQTEEWT